MEKFPNKFISFLKEYNKLFDLQKLHIDGRNQTIFKILNEKGLEDIMLSYWRTNKIQSLIRQLNYYGFYKLKKMKPKRYTKYAEYYYNIHEFNIDDVSTYYNISCKRYTHENIFNLKRKYEPTKNTRRIRLKMMNENLYSESKNNEDQKLYEKSDEDENSDVNEDDKSDEDEKSDYNEDEKLDSNEELNMISDEDLSNIYNDNFTNYFEYDEELSFSNIEVLLNEKNNLTFKFIDSAKDELNDFDIHSFNRDAIEKNKCDKSFSFIEDDITTYLNGSNYYNK